MLLLLRELRVANQKKTRRFFFDPAYRGTRRFACCKTTRIVKQRITHLDLAVALTGTHALDRWALVSLEFPN